ARGLAPLPGAGAWQRTWPDQAARVQSGHGPVWRVAAAPGEWNLRLRPRRRAAAAAAVRVFLSEQAAAVADGRHWAHQATYWLYHAASTDLRVALPEGATVLGITVDGAAVTALQPGANSLALWLPLPGASPATAATPNVGWQRRPRARWGVGPLCWTGTRTGRHWSLPSRTTAARTGRPLANGCGSYGSATGSWPRRRRG